MKLIRLFTIHVRRMSKSIAAPAFVEQDMQKPRGLFKEDFDFDHQANVLPGPEIGRYSVLTPSADTKDLVRWYYEDAKTLPQALARGVRLNPKGPCLGYRVHGKYHWITYAEAQQRIVRFCLGLLALGIEPNAKSHIGIYAKNSPLWFIAEHGCYWSSMVVVPFYDSFCPEACLGIIRRAKLVALVCDSEEKLYHVFDHVEKGVLKRDPVHRDADGDSRPLGHLRSLIMTKDFSETIRKRAESLGAEVYAFEEVERLGADSKSKPVPPKPSDLALICYTSGTSGTPKGVLLTHENVIGTVAGCLQHFESIGKRPEMNDVLISYLPMAHMLERIFQVSCYIAGASIGFYSGEVKQLKIDIKTLRPTVFPSVPRVLNRIHDNVMAGMRSNWITGFLVRRVLKLKAQAIEERRVGFRSFWERVIFYPVKRGLGGRVRVVIVGSAPTSDHVLLFTRCAFGCPVLEGYGQTETSAPCTLSFPDDETSGHVGVPLPSAHIKLSDVPEMNYKVARGDPGEICVRGTCVSKGYFEDEERTKERFFGGWLHTGDIGVFLPNGCLVIVDRISNMFKLPNGEFVAVEKLEYTYSRCPVVHQIFITGKPTKDILVALVVPEENQLRHALHGEHAGKSFESMCQLSGCTNLVAEEMAKYGKRYHLSKYEMIKKVVLIPEPFSEENGLLTPTQKLRRREILNRYKLLIDPMFM